jgi:cytochrome c oxidase accessory protein FixG
MREQVCKYMCPYARFQSAMFDKDTLIVSYDVARGEPRGPRGRSDDLAAKGLGACIDCELCVQVCPTGIDIRQGLQYECIGCAGCIDVCDSVMDKMHYPRGLIRFTTQNAQVQGLTRRQIWRRALRPRVLVYAVILGALTLAVGISLALRTPLKVDVVRDRASLARIVAGGQIENVYRLQIMNATEQPQSYRITAEGLPGLVVASQAEFGVEAAQSRWVAVRLQVPYAASTPGSHPIHFRIASVDDGAGVTEKSVFLLPRP